MSVPNIRPEPTRQAESLDRREFELERRRLPEPDHFHIATGRELVLPGQSSAAVVFGCEYPQKPIPLQGMAEMREGDATYATYPQITVTVHSWTTSGNLYTGAVLLIAYSGQVSRYTYAHWAFGGFV